MKRFMLVLLILTAFVAAPSCAAPVRCYYTGSIGRNILVYIDTFSGIFAIQNNSQQ